MLWRWLSVGGRLGSLAVYLTSGTHAHGYCTVGERVKIDLGFHEGAWILTSPRSSPLAELRIFLILENDPETHDSVLF